LGHYTDTWFNQDDLLKGRPYHGQTRHSNGSLLAETTNTWATASPYAGVSHARLVQTDVATCDDTGSSCRTARQSFEYDAYGNPTRLYRGGDVARSGDEIDERTDWVVDPATWIHRPNRFALYDAAGAPLRERSLAYDARWGERIGETDPNDRATTNVYDAFGRLAKITGPLDGASLFGSERRVYLDFVNPAAQRIRTYRTTVHGTSYAIWSDSYFD